MPAQPAIAYVKGNRELEMPLRFVRIEPYVVPKRSLTGEQIRQKAGKAGAKGKK